MEKFGLCKQKVENVIEKERASGTDIDIPCFYKKMYAVVNLYRSRG